MQQIANQCVETGEDWALGVGMDCCVAAFVSLNSRRGGDDDGGGGGDGVLAYS